MPTPPSSRRTNRPTAARPRLRARIANRRTGGLWWRIPLVALLWLALVAPLLAAGAIIAVLRHHAADLPPVPDLDRWAAELPQTSIIVAADGTIAAELPFRVSDPQSESGDARPIDRVGHRFAVAFADLPQRLIEAVLAAEDIRFFEHPGVDIQAVVRAAWANYRAERIVEGASTLTQQVARNLLPVAIGRERSLRRKIREALLALRIEARYSKQRIFEVYVNQVFLGAGAYGVAAAARAYFAAPLRELDAAQTALIAGMAQAPGRTNPHRRPRPARMRRDEVLTRMAAAGFISADEAAAARAQPLALRAPPKRYGSVAPWHTEHVRRQLAKTHPAALGRGGLRIDTAALPGLAARSEILAREWSSALGRGRPHGPPQLGAVVWDHRTGYVEAMVGGLSWTDSRFDRAAQACRQPGSAFKPIVYAAALVHDAITPGTALRDAPIAEYDEDLQVHWKPDNSGRSFRGVALAQDALAASLNAAAVDVLDRVGGARVIAVARRLGLTTELADVRPLALGASCVIPLELAGAYAIFAQDGARVEPIFAVRVSRGGRVLFDRASPRDPHLEPRRRLDRFIAANAAAATGATEPVIDRYSAFLMSTMLAEVVKRGTATAARRLGRPAAGKTGTTNDNTDAWFVGYTGRLVAAVWVGHDDPARTLGRSDDGSRAALPLWIRLIAAAEGERPPRAVPGPPPDGLRQARIDRETGKRAPPGVGGGALLYFKPGTEPIEQTGHIPGVPSDLSRAAREF